MQPGKKGSEYKRSSGLVEIEVLRSATYDQVTLKIAEDFGLSLEENEAFALFKMNGSRILDKDYTCSWKTKTMAYWKLSITRQKVCSSVQTGNRSH